MYPQKQEITLFEAVTPVAVISSTDVTPIVVTATAHGLITGDRVLIIGHTTNLVVNGISKITKITADTFSLQDEFTGSNVTTTGGGAGSSGLLVKAPPVLDVSGYRNIVLQIGTSGSTTANLKIAGSLGKTKSYQLAVNGPRYDFTNFAATISPANSYTYLQAINLDTATAVNGVTGIAATGTDLNTIYEVNVNAMKYLTVFPSTWTQGAITVKALLVTNS